MTDKKKKKKAEESQKSVEMKTARSEAIYREAITRAGGVPYQLRYSDNVYTFVGEGAEELLGIPGEQLTLGSFQGLVQSYLISDTKVPVGRLEWEVYAKEFHGGRREHYHTDILIRTPQGVEKWLSDHSVPVRDGETGEVIGCLGILQDITDRKLAQEAIARSEAIHREAIEKTGGVPYELRFSDGVYTFGGEGVAKLFDIPTEKLTSADMDKFISTVELAIADPLRPVPAGDNVSEEEWDEYVRQFREGETDHYHIEYRARILHGTEKWVSDHAVPVLDKNTGKVIGSLGILHDITYRKRRETEELALHSIREEVWKMKTAKDFEKVLTLVEEKSKALKIPFQGCAITTIDTSKEPAILRQYYHGMGDTWRMIECNATQHSAPFIMKMWELGVPCYRKDLLAEDIHGEREAFEGYKPRSVVDVPFAHGTFSLDSEEPDPFSNNDIEFMKKVAEALDEGYLRVQDLQNLSLSEQKYKTLVETPDIVVFLLDLNSICRYVSPKITDWTGLSPDEFYGEKANWSAFLHPDDFESVNAAFRRVVELNEPQNIEFRWRNRTGEYRWASASIFPVRDERGTFDTVQIVISDITESKTAQEAIAHSEAVYREAIQRAGGVPYQLRYSDETYTFMGEGMENLIGLSRKELTAAKLRELIQEATISDFEGRAEREELDNYAREFREGKKDHYHTDFCIRTPEGVERWLSDYSVPIHDKETGEVTGSLGILQDITTRKHKEQEELALHSIREEVWRMKTVNDFEKVMTVIGEQLKTLHILFHACKIYIMDTSKTPAVIREYHQYAGASWQYTEHDESKHSGPIIMKMWKAGVPAYRKDLLAEDPYEERGTFGDHEPRCLLDVPSEHGMISIVSDEPDPFSDEEIEFMKKIANTLDEGYMRIDDLQKLSQSEQRYRTLVETPDSVVMLFNLEGDCLYASPQIHTWTGIRTEAFCEGAEKLSDIVHPEDKTIVAEAFRKVPNIGAPLSVEFRWKSKTGEYRWAHSSIVPVYREKENLDAIQMIISDITERRRDEQALREKEQAERHFADQLTALHEITIELSLVFTFDDLCRQAIQLGSSRLGFDRMGIWLRGDEPSTIIGTFGMGEDGRLRDERGARITCHPESPMGRIISQNIPSYFNEDAELFNHHGDLVGRGNQACAAMWDGEKLIGAISIDNLLSGEPITEQMRELLILYASAIGHFFSLKRAEKERQTLEAQMRQAQKLESLGVLAGGIAHDFNNLLMGILGNADLAELKLPPGSPALENVREIENIAERAADLAQQMLAYSGKGSFVIEPVSVSEIVENMAHLLEVSISKKVMINYRLDKNVPAVEADVTQLRQIIMNLITNASEAIGEEQGVISVATSVAECDEEYLSTTYLPSLEVATDEKLPAGTYVCLEVADSGCGMEKETYDRLFDPFFSTKMSGRGLGMSAVLGIVRGHKGAIEVKTKPGKGSVFKVLFPTVAYAPASLEKESGEIDGWRGSGTILLVDDDKAIREVGKKLLEHMGFDVIVAEDGHKGVELYQKHAKDVVCVLLDLTMPRMGGEETLVKLQEINKNVRVILSSGYSETHVETRFADGEIAGFIQKPYRSKALASMIRQVLEG